MTKKTKADRWVSKLERAFSSKAKLVLAAAAAATIAVSSWFAWAPSTPSRTVMIKNLGETTGGSGVILESNQNKSKILTNAHICAVVKKGGYVYTIDGNKYFVASYIMSKRHDACMITVNTDLGVDTDLASSAPETHEKATIAGHPALLPTVISRGHFAKRQTIHLLNSFRKCTKAEKKDPRLGFACFRFGKLPVFKAYESIVVTATIMGGSSGSAVYDSSGDVAGLAFAGNGRRQLSYAFVVPYEYVSRFVLEEAPSYEQVYPDYTVDIQDLLKSESAAEAATAALEKELQEFITTCESLDTDEAIKVEAICSQVVESSEIER